jgi:hypothetical protein
VLVADGAHLHGDGEFLQAHVLDVDELFKHFLRLLSHSSVDGDVQPLELVFSAHQCLHLRQFLQLVDHQQVARGQLLAEERVQHH